MSQYNKTVLTNAGLELAKRANAGQAKFEITRAVTSADDWSNKTIQDIEAVTAIPNIMQQGTIRDTEEVESNNSVIGVSLCFANKDLSAGYQIRIIGLYVKEEGQENDFLYAVTTAIAPEYMPSFADKVLYRFNMQMYLVIGKAQAVNVVINDGASVTHRQFDNYKNEVTANLKKIENAHKEDMSHVAKSASINGGAEILPDSTGKLNLVVPDPDLSKYVSLEQLGELLQAKADKADVYTKTETDNQINKFDLSKVKFRKQYVNSDGQTADKTWSATKNEDGTYTIDLYNDDWTAAKLHDVLAQLPSKADTSTVNAQIADAKNTAQSNLDKAKNDLNDAINAKANASDVYTKTEVDSKTSGTIVTAYDIANKNPTKETNSYTYKWLVDQNVLGQFADAINDINGTWNRYTHNDGFDLLTLWGQYGIHYCLNDNMTNVPDWFGDKRGTAFVFKFDGFNDTMIYASCTFSGFAYYNGYEKKWHKLATDNDITDLQNQIQQLKDNQFEVQTFTDATAAANWEAQKPGKRMAIVNS